jgi:hypothetical protein
MQHGVDGVRISFLLIKLGSLAGCLLGLLVPQGLVQLLLLLQVVLQQLDVVPVLLQRLLATARDGLHQFKI